MNTQQLIDRFHITGIVFSGIAGGVNPSLNIGDVTVPAQWGQHQENVFARATDDGWDPRGIAGEHGNFGMMFPRGQRIVREGEPANDPRARRFWFPADERMLGIAREVAHTVPLDRCTEAGDCLHVRPTVVVGGNGLSGPTFLDNAEYREWLWRTFLADAVDMESAAVAHVAHVNRIPWIVFRSLSDLAGGDASGNRIRTFGRLAADNSAKVLLEFLTRWAEVSGDRSRSPRPR
jgi:adenosylhomocysteine nucleosidase